MLDAAIWSPYPNLPSEKIYGENAKAGGKALSFYEPYVRFAS
jgi:hypothetical protein